MRNFPKTKPALLHAGVLIGSSAIGLAGYYRQHHVFQITACIPAAVGALLLLLAHLPLRRERLRAWLLLLLSFGFGLVVTRLALRFVAQDFQPLRKRLYFPAMALSSLLTCLLLARALWRKHATPPNR